MDTMIELPAMRRSAELAPNTADADSRTVEVIWSAGARVRRAHARSSRASLHAQHPMPAASVSQAVPCVGPFGTRPTLIWNVTHES